MNAIEAHIDNATIEAIAQLIVERFEPDLVARKNFKSLEKQRHAIHDYL